MSGNYFVGPARILRHAGSVTIGPDASSFTLETRDDASNRAEVILDYGQCEGGLPTFEVACASGDISIEMDIVYSEGIDGIDRYTGDGPFFLFSNAMDTYRRTSLTIPTTTTPQMIRAVYSQRSQRYQKLILTTPNTSVTFSKVAFERIRPAAPAKSTFRCSNELLNRVWHDGVKTVDMCTVAREETTSAWEVTDDGTRVRGQHWAPCRHGTRWGDKIVRFQAQIESGGASWAVHMVTNGLIFCLDVAEKVLYACEGLSTESTIFPVSEKGRWPLGDLDMDAWLDVETITRKGSVTVSVQGCQVALIENLDIRPILGGSPNNTGSVAFGGPCQWVARYRQLSVHDLDRKILYENTLLLTDHERTLADFQVGTNLLACTIDGAKRDRACFGGDLYVMGRSIAHSTMAFEAIAGSIELLTSHQTSDGYLGNLCPIQAPVHDNNAEPPTYAFYSLSYALLLVVAIKDYWLHTGDEKTRALCIEALERLMEYTENHISQGVVIAPPPLSMHWFPLGGPVFGASSAVNNAYYEALQAMAILSTNSADKNKYQLQAHKLKINMLGHFYDPSTGIYHLDKSLPASGVCQDVKAHAITLDLIPPHQDDLEHLIDTESPLPRAFRNLGHWDVANVASPYASGFAVEALLSRDRGVEAVNLIERVWGPMADATNPNYSGGHWEAMKPDGTPHGHDTSLIHGWSTWPVSLMPRYLAGLQPTEPGWKSFCVAPVLAGLKSVKCTLKTVAGTVGVEFEIDETSGHGTLQILAPQGVIARLQSPQGWIIKGPETFEGQGVWKEFFLSEVSSNADLETEDGVQQVVNLADASSQIRERQERNASGKIRSLLTRFTAMFS